MKRSIVAILLAVICCSFAVVPVFADEVTEPTNSESAPERLVDGADLLTDSQEEALLKTLDEISKRQKCDVVIVTEENLQTSTAQDDADDFFDYNGYGYGKNRDGILLLISIGDRDWSISTRGFAIKAFTDKGQKYLVEQFKDDLSEGNYNEAFTIYAQQCDEFLTQAKTGKPYDGSNLPREPLSWVWIPISIVVGIIIALIIVSGMKRKLKSVAKQKAANSYVRNGSLNVTDSRDLFLYRTVNRREKPKSTSSDDYGSSTHTSSSGATHGGSSGKF